MKERMNGQQSFTDIEYTNRKRATKREVFLKRMNAIVPWDEWVEIVKPYYPSGKRGRRPKEIEQMLRMVMLQMWFNLSDEGVEDAIYDSYAMKSFMGINFLPESRSRTQQRCANFANCLTITVCKGVSLRRYKRCLQRKESW